VFDERILAGEVGDATIANCGAVMMGTWGGVTVSSFLIFLDWRTVLPCTVHNGINASHRVLYVFGATTSSLSTA
jgi:hypothetical protein